MAPKKNASAATAEAAKVVSPLPKAISNYSPGTQNNRRHWLVAILMQIGIRLRYIYESRFGIIPIFYDLNENPSPWRPKTCPK